MRPVCVITICCLLAACATTAKAEPDLAKQLARCAVVADSLIDSDTDYKRWRRNFMGAGGKLVSGGPFLQLMMNEPLPSASAENQRTALKEEVERCKMLMLNNMDKFGGSKGR